MTGLVLERLAPLKILSTIFSLIYGLSSKGKIGKNQYVQSLVLAISNDENGPITFSKPAQEASPVLTLGKFQGSGMDYTEPLPLPILSANRE